MEGRGRGDDSALTQSQDSEGSEVKELNHPTISEDKNCILRRFLWKNPYKLTLILSHWFCSCSRRSKTTKHKTSLSLSEHCALSSLDPISPL